MELFILTGASRGLGAALAGRLLAPGRQLLALSRNPAAALEQQARARGAALEQWSVDLVDAPAVAARLEDWLQQRSQETWQSATLINNAGLLGRVGPIDAFDAATVVAPPSASVSRALATELAAVIRVDLEAPMVLTAAFLRATATWSTLRRVLNISSGAGRNAYAGWAAYCAAKAGLDHFSRAVALDEARRPDGKGARIVSLAPGVIDTDMQTALRAADGDGFPELARFVSMKANGQLATPEAAAERVLAYLVSPAFGSQPVADVRSL